MRRDPVKEARSACMRVRQRRRAVPERQGEQPIQNYKSIEVLREDGAKTAQRMRAVMRRRFENHNKRKR